MNTESDAARLKDIRERLRARQFMAQFSYDDMAAMLRLLSERDATIRDLRAEVERLTKALSRIAMLSGHSQKKSIIAGEALARSHPVTNLQGNIAGSSVTADGVQGGEQPAAERPFWMTAREITHDEAREVAQRLVNSHFQKEPRARVGIPARPDYDDDLLIHAYIEQQRARVPAAQPLRQEKPVADEPVRKESLYTESAPSAEADAMATAREIYRSWFYSDGGTSAQMIEDIAAALLAHGRAEREGAIAEAAQWCEAERNRHGSLHTGNVLTAAAAGIRSLAQDTSEKTGS